MVTAPQPLPSASLVTPGSGLFSARTGLVYRGPGLLIPPSDRDAFTPAAPPPQQLPFSAHTNIDSPGQKVMR